MKRHRTSRTGTARNQDEASSAVSEEKNTEAGAVGGPETDVSQGEFESQENDAFVKSPALGVENSFNGHFDPYENGYDARGGERGEGADEPLMSELGRSLIPEPEVFNAYPIEVQRKIMEWTDRDIKARRDDESRRQDELMRAEAAHRRTKQTIPAVIIILAIVCAAVTGVITRNPAFPIAFLVVPLAVIIGGFISDNNANKKRDSGYKHRRL